MRVVLQHEKGERGVEVVLAVGREERSSLVLEEWIRGEKDLNMVFVRNVLQGGSRNKQLTRYLPFLNSEEGGKAVISSGT